MHRRWGNFRPKKWRALTSRWNPCQLSHSHTRYFEAWNASCPRGDVSPKREKCRFYRLYVGGGKSVLARMFRHGDMQAAGSLLWRTSERRRGKFCWLRYYAGNTRLWDLVILALYCWTLKISLTDPNWYVKWGTRVWKGIFSGVYDALFICYKYVYIHWPRHQSSPLFSDFVMYPTWLYHSQNLYTSITRCRDCNTVDRISNFTLVWIRRLF